MDAFEVLAAALHEVRRVAGVEYADARAVELERETVKLRNLDVDRMDHDTSAGVAVRVLFHGAWGFGARPGIGEAEAVAAARDALAVARAAAASSNYRVRLAEEEAERGEWRSTVEIDPFAVPLEQKLADLRAAVTAARAHLTSEDAARVRVVEARQLWQRERKHFLSTEGARNFQDKTLGGGGIKITAQAGDEVAVRSWPIDLDGGVTAAGYEAMRKFDLAAHAPRLADEALALLTAPPCPAGETDLILGTAQLALQIHESCGHPTEGDRAIGEEISLAGASFLTPDKLGRFVYGAPKVNLVADSLTPGALGSFGWDDEGVPARRTPLVSRGIFVGYLSSREMADKLGLGRSAGCMRAESWSRPPIVRMINVSLEPDPSGPESLEALIADTREGLLMTENRSWSIDDLRLNFQFGCEAAWEIKGGKRTRLLKRPMYTGITPRFWAGCEVIGGPGAKEMYGFLSCGKGDPIQLMAVGHGCPPARFKKVSVGSSAS